jgi:hypothetical protein
MRCGLTRATTAEATVMERAVHGSCPRLTKKLVHTMAPRPLETMSYCTAPTTNVRTEIQTHDIVGPSLGDARPIEQGRPVRRSDIQRDFDILETRGRRGYAGGELARARGQPHRKVIWRARLRRGQFGHDEASHAAPSGAGSGL